jgi:mRNA interferase RelE/StbE
LKVRFKASFASDLRALKDKSLLERIKALITTVESAETPLEIPNVKKLRGGGAYYRVRLGDYRVGLDVEENAIVFVRVLHRREVYRYFP